LTNRPLLCQCEFDYTGDGSQDYWEEEPCRKTQGSAQIIGRKRVGLVQIAAGLKQWRENLGRLASCTSVVQGLNRVIIVAATSKVVAVINPQLTSPACVNLLGKVKEAISAIKQTGLVRSYGHGFNPRTN
jgi:hypothetical protein